MKKGFMFWTFISLLVIVVTGCMYPEDKLVQNVTAYSDQVGSVQSAVTQFQKDHDGILPIKTFGEETPLYQKYQIDFKKLVPQYLAEPPGNAYESGGVFQYVIANAENDPTVRMFDLRIAEMISEIKLRMGTQGYPPFKEKVAENVYTIDFKKLGYEEPTAVSPFTNKPLSFVINGQAEIFVDYRSDLYEVLKRGEYSVQPGADIRDILWQDSLFVPAYSLPYTIEQATNEPIFLTK